MIIAACLATTATTTTAEEPTYRIQLARPLKAGHVYRIDGQSTMSAVFTDYDGGKEGKKTTQAMTLRFVADMTADKVDDDGSILLARFAVKTLAMTAGGETNDVLPEGTIIEQRKGEVGVELLVGGEMLDDSLAVPLGELLLGQDHVSELQGLNPPLPVAVGESWPAVLPPRVRKVFTDMIEMEEDKIDTIEISGKLEKAEAAPVNRTHVVITLGSADQEYRVKDGDSMKFYGTTTFHLPLEPTSPAISWDRQITMIMKSQDADGNLTLAATMGQITTVTLSPVPKD